jgi:hypothetical protein
MPPRAERSKNLETVILLYPPVPAVQKYTDRKIRETAETDG